MTSLQKLLLTLFFLIIAAYSLYEVYDELSDLALNKVSLWHVTVEILIVIISFSGLSYITYIMYAQNKEKSRLKHSLNNVRKDLESSNIRLHEGKKEYQKVIQWQFSEWKLSPSEKEVALLLLKGLSIKEVATCRNTQEKTVRKQASAVYEKSKLSGRHELSAWFFEDML